jgi:hypothetical protein
MNRERKRPKAVSIVTPAEAGVQKIREILDSRLRGNDTQTAISYLFSKDGFMTEGVGQTQRVFGVRQ